MRDGRPVVVKVQRPGVRQIIVEDLEALAQVADFIDALQDSQLDKGPLGPVMSDPPAPWPLRSAHRGERYH